LLKQGWKIKLTYYYGKAHEILSQGNNSHAVPPQSNKTKNVRKTSLKGGKRKESVLVSSVHFRHIAVGKCKDKK
jgi:outer membrane receptor for ferric coprogen and ferric-rhodotorulic acid